MIVVDDHRLVAGLAAASLPTDGAVATTCSWWWRLASAVAGDRHGVLSSRFAGLDPSQRRALRATIATLDARVVVLDLRALLPAMASLAREHAVNLLTAEAIVVADVLRADLVLGRDTPKVRDIAAALGLGYTVVAS